tara:strand:+ start:184 stop:933 length:750 start_codon:yes stop_codon:yes gene_type:complete
MLNRPSPIPKNSTSNTHYSEYSKLLPGTFLHEILYGKRDTQSEQRKPFYVQNHKNYLENLEKNYKYYGVPFKKPNVEEIPPYENNSKPVEMHIEYLDTVTVKLNVLKSGKVRVKLSSQMMALNENYYSKGKPPPIKSVLSALKNIGYSNESIDGINEKYKKRKKLIEIKWKKLESILDAPSLSRTNKKKSKKKEKVKEEEIEEHKDDEPSDDIPKSDEPEEDEGMDMEMDIDEDDEQNEEEYVSDGGED